VLEFDSPAQDLNAALLAFAERAGLQVFYDVQVVQGLRSAPVRGGFTPEQGLAQLLAGTGMAFRFSGPNTVSLEKPASSGAAGPGVMELAPVQVEAANPNAMVGDPPPAYAGGQVARGGRVGALGNRDMMDTPFNMSSFTEETIRNKQAETIAEVLANDPAVRTTYSFGNFGEQFVIRGFPLNGEDVAIDGLFGTAPRQITATEMYERVEVLRGANAFLNGAGPGNTGIGGTVNLVPKRAGSEPLTRLTASYAQESRFGGHADIARRFGPDGVFGVRGNAAIRGGETAIEDEERSLRLASLALDYRGKQARATLDLGYQRQKVEQGRPVVFVTGPAVPEPPSADANYGQPWSYSTLRDAFAQFRGELDITSNFMGYLAVGGRDMREDGDYASPTVNGAGVGTVGRLTVPREDYAVTGQGGLRANVATGPVLHNLDGGVSALRTVNRNAFEFGATQATTLYDTPDLPRPGATLASGNFDDLPKVSQTDLRSYFFSDTASILDERVLLTAGFRHQRIEVLGYNRATGAVTSNFDDYALSPVVGLVVKPLPQLSLYFNRIEGLAQGQTAPASAVNVGQVFPPFKSTQYEVGSKLDLGRFGATLALFQTTQPSGITDPDTLVFGVDGEQRNRGIEILLFGEPMAGLRLLGGATLNDAVLESTAGGTNDGNAAVGVPDYQVNAGVEWDPWFLRQLTVSARVLYTGSQYLDAANTQKIPGWTRLDLGARYTTKVEDRTLVFRANVENVANESYWASANGGYLTQGAPLTAKLSVSLDF